jgi:soluble lytic murein transglycosylase-like protein
VAGAPTFGLAAPDRPFRRPGRGPLAAFLLAIALPLGGAGHAEPPAPPPSGAGGPYAAILAEAAQRFGLPPGWIFAVLRAESGGDPRAISPKGALGLMQLEPQTWADLRIRHHLGADVFDPHDNIIAGAAFLRELLDRYGSPGFLAAYNAGPARYEDYLAGRQALPPETAAYVAALAPRIGAAMGPSTPSTTAPPSLAWTRAPLFAPHAIGAQTASSATPATFVAAQSTGLFARLSGAAGAR